MISKNIGFAFCGSYCTFDRAIGALERAKEIYKRHALYVRKRLLHRHQVRHGEELY